MQLPWQHHEGREEGGASAAREVAPSRIRRWRRVVARRPVVAPPAPPAPALVTDATPSTTLEPARPGFLAVAIARVLIAIDFALGRPR